LKTTALNEEAGNVLRHQANSSPQRSVSVNRTYFAIQPQTFHVKMVYPLVEMHVENLYLSVANCMSLLPVQSFPQQRRLEDLGVFR
jgi:hypothetical protein